MDADRAKLLESLPNDVSTRLADTLPRVTAYRGPSYADSDEPNARALRASGGGFQWVAFGFDPHPMWDAHVGVLVSDEVVVGLHVSDRVTDEKPPSAVALAETIGATYEYSEVAGEHQFNRPGVPLDEVVVETLGSEVASLCQQFEPIVDPLLDHDK